jgi:protein-disulfide isomerase-like protein with CxxC motif
MSMLRINRHEQYILNAIERSELDTSKPFTAKRAREVLSMTGTRNNEKTTLRQIPSAHKLNRIFKKCSDYELVVNWQRSFTVEGKSKNMWRRV